MAHSYVSPHSKTSGNYTPNDSVLKIRHFDLLPSAVPADLLLRMRELHAGNKIERALSKLNQPYETPFVRRFRKRVTLGFQFFRFIVSFLFVMLAGNAYAHINYAKKGSTVLYAPTTENQAIFEVAYACALTNTQLFPDYPAITTPKTDSVPQQPRSTEVKIHGYVIGVPNYNNLHQAKVLVIDPETNIHIDSTTTYSSGLYILDFIWTNINSENLEHQLYAYPNPYNGSTNLEIVSPKSGNYDLKVFDIQGKLLYLENLTLAQGQNRVVLRGGNAGVHLISLSNGSDSKIYKTVKMDNAGENFSTSTQHDFNNNSNNYKSTLDGITDGAEVKMVFSKDGYVSKDTTFTLRLNNTIDMALGQIPQIFSTTLKPFLDDGLPVTTLSPGWSTTIEFPAPPLGPGTKNYTPNANNEIIIQENFYPLNGEPGNAIMHHDTSNYTLAGVPNGVLSWIILRKQNQSTSVRNPVQTSSSDLIPDATTNIPLDSLNGRTLNYYMLPKKAQTQPGTWFRMDHLMVRGYMAASGDGLRTSKFIDIPPYSHVVLMSTVYENNPDQYATQESLDRAVNHYNECASLCIMANNDNIMQNTQLQYTNRNDATWTNLQSRTPPFDNVEFMTFDQTSPCVDRFWANTYTYDGENRLIFTEARYPESATNGTIFTENYSATYGITEGSGGLAPYVYTNGEATDLAGRMGRWVKMLDLGSGNDSKKNKFW